MTRPLIRGQLILFQSQSRSGCVAVYDLRDTFGDHLLARVAAALVAARASVELDTAHRARGTPDAVWLRALGQRRPRPRVPQPVRLCEIFHLAIEGSPEHAGLGASPAHAPGAGRRGEDESAGSTPLRTLRWTAKGSLVLGTLLGPCAVVDPDDRRRGD